MRQQSHRKEPGLFQGRKGRLEVIEVVRSESPSTLGEAASEPRGSDSGNTPGDHGDNREAHSDPEPETSTDETPTVPVEVPPPKKPKGRPKAVKPDPEPVPDHIVDTYQPPAAFRRRG